MSRKRKIAAGLAGAALTVAVVFLLLTSAHPSGRTLPTHTPDPARGEVLYHVGGCVSCHRASVSDGVEGLPSGGAEFPTPVGTFWPGNLTPDQATGLGGWTPEQFVNAMVDGVSPDGRHYFPAFPYTSYRAMPVEDLLDQRLAAVERVAAHPLKDPRQRVLHTQRVQLDAKYRHAV